MEKFTIHGQISFGPWSRYMLKDCTDRFGNKVWIVTDAEMRDSITERPGVIRQSKTREDALAGLE